MKRSVVIARALSGAAALAVLCTAYPPISAQQGSPRPLAYDLIPTREQAEALLRVWNERLSYVPGEVLVKFRSGVAADGRTAALASARTRIDERNARWIGDTLWLRSNDESDSEHLAFILSQQPEVEWAQPNYVSRTSNTVPNDPSYNRQWNFDLIEMPRAWDINKGSTDSITVAVIDSGVTATTDSFTFPTWTGTQIESISIAYRVSPDIAAARILPGRDYVFWSGPVLDMDGHGTHVAGTVLEETNNNLALAGIAYRAKLLPLKVCLSYWDIQFITSSRGITGFVDPDEGGICQTSAGVQALRFAADSGAQIANMSFGGNRESAAFLDALRYATGRGTFVAIAVGNEFEDGNPIEYPAGYAPQVDGVMSVGAVGRSSRRAFYSNTGAHLEISAPGGDRNDGGTTGLVYQTTLVPADSDPFTIIRPRFDRFAEVGYQGTSMAAPHVAGVAALLRSQGITTPEAIEAAIKRFARDLGTSGRDNDFGFGLVDARSALRGLGAAK